MKDMHPMLVLSPKPFNERTGIVIGLPMTTAAFNETNPFAIKFQGPRNVTSYVLGHSPSLLIGERGERKPIRGSVRPMRCLQQPVSS